MLGCVSDSRRISIGVALAVWWSAVVSGGAGAQSAASLSSGEAVRVAAEDTQSNVLTSAEWDRVDAAVQRALAWLAGEQQPDGSFPTLDMGQPGVTCLCTMAFMAHGHVPGTRPYGDRLERATDFVLGCQKENGLISVIGPEGPRVTRDVIHDIGVAAAYNHAIASLMLSEMYGMSEANRAQRIQAAINQSIRVSLEMQRWPKNRPEDQGGWRYVDDFDHHDSDLSITGWELMFLRSARNAGFDVPKAAIVAAVQYVRRTYSQEYGAFGYIADRGDFRSRCMAGAGILALAHAGYHNAPEAQRSGQWILQYNFDAYNQIEPFTQGWKNDRYHYGLFNCCQGMYQLGGRYWEEFFPGVVRTVLANQRPDGAWEAENHHHDAQFGNAYTTALVVMSLGAPNQLLPVFQR